MAILNNKSIRFNLNINIQFTSMDDAIYALTKDFTLLMKLFGEELEYNSTCWTTTTLLNGCSKDLKVKEAAKY